MSFIPNFDTPDPHHNHREIPPIKPAQNAFDLTPPQRKPAHHLREYLDRQFHTKNYTLVPIDDLYHPDGDNKEVQQALQAIRQRLDNPDCPVVISFPIEKVERYHQALDTLLPHDSHMNLYGQTHTAAGHPIIHFSHTPCFIGYRDIREPDKSPDIHEHNGHTPDEEQGYEFKETCFDRRLLREPFNVESTYAWKDFLPVLPLKSIIVAGDETPTAITPQDKLARELGVSALYIKDESRNFTRSFKDRMMLTMINKAMELGYRHVAMNSSGNAAVAAAALASRADIRCIAVVPENTSETKISLLQEFGADTTILPGNYEENHRWLLQNINSKTFNITPGATGLGLDGIKIMAYELYRAGRCPDIVVAPAGNGSLIAGLYKGFKELKEMGYIAKLPRLVAVQVKDAAPLKLALERGTFIERAENIPDSHAEAIIAEESFSSPMAVEALRKSNGFVVEVTDEEIEKSHREVRREHGLVCELSSAAAFAALHKMQFAKEDEVCVINTAGGDKDLLKSLSEEKRKAAPQVAILTELDEFKAIEELQQSVFGFEDREVCPSEVLQGIQKSGGIVLGLKQKEKLVGFSWGFRAEDEIGKYLLSDLAGIAKELQSSGLGYELKVAQGQFATEKGFSRIKWTFDPMLTKNARLNFGKLRARGVAFQRDVYGESSSELYRGLPTNRLLVEWMPAETRAARNGHSEERFCMLAVDNGLPRVNNNDSESPCIVAEVPLNYLEIKEQSEKDAQTWQEAFAHTAEILFAKGYVVDDFEVDRWRNVGRYIFRGRN